MYTTKRSKQEEKKRLAALIRYNHDLESNPEAQQAIASWQEFVHLSPSEQTKRIQEWEGYYQNVNQSPLYALFQEQRTAAKKRNWARVKELAGQAKQMRIHEDDRTVPMPTHSDPWEFTTGWVKAYTDCERCIRELHQNLAGSSSDEAVEIWREEVI